LFEGEGFCFALIHLVTSSIVGLPRLVLIFYPVKNDIPVNINHTFVLHNIYEHL